jgi:hypothetical protein
METEHVNLCNDHAIRLLFLHTSFGWKRYMLNNTPTLGYYTKCDYVGTECSKPATDKFEKTWGSDES